MQTKRKQEDSPKFQLVVGSETGLLKGISCEKSGIIFKNINTVKEPDRDLEICSLGSSTSGDILVGLRNRLIRVYSDDFTSSKSMDINCGSGRICSLGSFEQCVVAAVTSGEIIICKDDPLKFKVCHGEQELECMRQCSSNKGLICIAGKELLPSIWDLNNPEKALFNGKNVKLDNLQLRVPVWTSAVQFLNDENKLCACTKLSQIQVYDRRVQRRPVLNIVHGDDPLTALAVLTENEIVLGDRNGKVIKFDLRKKAICGGFKGSAGVIRDLQLHSQQPYLAVVGADRFLHIYDVNSCLRVQNIYLKSKLTCSLWVGNIHCNMTKHLKK